jgi:hypothetical protein
VEVVLEIDTGVSEEVNEGTLLNEIVFLIEAYICHLFFGLDKMDRCLCFNNIRPLGTQLLQLVSGVNVVESGEFWTWEPVEVTNFCVTKVITDHEFVMENHISNPLVVRPSTHSSDRGD